MRAASSREAGAEPDVGGAVMGIGMTMLGETVFDRQTRRIANATFGDYLIPANADAPDVDVVFRGHAGHGEAISIEGLGEIGVVGVSAGIADAVYHATGGRVRSLPITVEQFCKPGVSGALPRG
jgi:xanthine dehydrogenase YagR molybdenum-binding subunit